MSFQSPLRMAKKQWKNYALPQVAPIVVLTFPKERAVFSTVPTRHLLVAQNRRIRLI